MGWVLEISKAKESPTNRLRRQRRLIQHCFIFWGQALWIWKQTGLLPFRFWFFIIMFCWCFTNRFWFVPHYFVHWLYSQKGGWIIIGWNSTRTEWDVFWLMPCSANRYCVTRRVSDGSFWIFLWSKQRYYQCIFHPWKKKNTWKSYPLLLRTAV